MFSSGDGFAAAHDPPRLSTPTPTEALPTIPPAAALPSLPTIPRVANSLSTLTQPSATTTTPALPSTTPALFSTTTTPALASTTTTPTVDPLPPVVDASVDELLLQLQSITSDGQTLRQEEALLEEEKEALRRRIEEEKEGLRRRSSAMSQRMEELRRKKSQVEAQLRRKQLEKRHAHEAAESGKFYINFFS